MINDKAQSIQIWTLIVAVIVIALFLILTYLYKAGILSNFSLVGSIISQFITGNKGISKFVQVQTSFTPYNCSSSGCIPFSQQYSSSFWWADYDGNNQSNSLNQPINFTTTSGNFYLVMYPADANNMFYCPTQSIQKYQTGENYKVNYEICGVTFSEIGLPSGYTWIASYNNKNYSSNTPYIPVIANAPGYYHVWNLSNTSFNQQLMEACTTTYKAGSNAVGVLDSAGSTITVPFTSQTKCEKIITTFTERGLPPGYEWRVNYTYWNSSSGNTITFSSLSGPHNVKIPALSNSSNNCVSVYTPQNVPTSVQAGTQVSINFKEETYCLTTFYEQNLPPGYKWMVKYDNQMNQTETSATGSKLTLNASEPSSSLTANASVSGLYCGTSPSQTDVTVQPGGTYTFNSWLCNSTFNETGLPSGTEWNITYNGIYQTSTSHIIKFVNMPSSSSKLEFTAYPITVSTGTTNVATFSIVGYGGQTGGNSASYSLPSGASLYLCNGGDGNGALSSYSWSADTTTFSSYASIGHQSGNVCSDSSLSSDIAVGGAAIDTNTQYSLQTQTFSGNSFSYTYSESQSADVIISISCGWYECNSITVPSGCQQLFYQNGGDYYETTYMAVCYNQGAGSYRLSGGLNGNGYVAVGVYSFPISANTISSAYYYYPKPSSGYNYTGLNETINYSLSVKLPPNVVYYVPITITNNQNTPTPSPFQQEISVPSWVINAYASSNMQNTIFFYKNGQVIPSWLETYSYPNSATYWVKLSNSIPADSSITIYMGFGYTSTNLFNNVNDGEAPQLSPVYGEYNDIANVMNSGLEYQIYYDPSGECDSQNYQNQVYAATLNNGVTIESCAPMSSSTNPFYTNLVGSSQVVNGMNENNVIFNYQEDYKSGAPYPDPPIPPLDTTNSWIIKAIGWAQVNSPVTFYVGTDDGIALGYSTSSYSGNGAYWLGGSSNPNNIISQWHEQSFSVFSGAENTIGTVRLEMDYYEGPTQAYTALWSSAPVYYYSPTAPPNGVMPSVQFVYSGTLTTFTESGLPSGAGWWVDYDGINESSTSTSISFKIPPGTYSFSTGAFQVSNSPTYTPSPASGSLAAGNTQSISFSSVNYPGIPAFTASGSWDVDSTNTQTDPGNTIVPDGNYGYIETNDPWTGQWEEAQWEWTFPSSLTGTFYTKWYAYDALNGGCQPFGTDVTLTWAASNDGSTWTTFYTHTFTSAGGVGSSTSPEITDITGTYKYIRVTQYSNTANMACPMITWVDGVWED